MTARALGRAAAFVATWPVSGDAAARPAARGCRPRRGALHVAGDGRRGESTLRARKDPRFRGAHGGDGARAEESGGYEERDVRAALEHDVAEQMLASLAEKLIVDSPADKRPALDEVPRIEQQVGAAFSNAWEVGARVDDAAQAEQIDESEVEVLLHRAALAAWYLDRAVTPILHPSEEQLRDVFRTSAHPYRGQTFDGAREALSRLVRRRASARSRERHFYSRHGLA